jgi:O-antigen/teichoic acid export membrane protein
VRLAAEVISLPLKLVMLSVVSRHLGKTDYGVFSLTTTTVVVLMPLVSLRLQTACARFLPQMLPDRARIWRQFALTLGIVGAAGLGWLAVAGLVQRPASIAIFDDAEHAYLIPELAALMALQALVTHCVDFYRAVNRTDVASLLGVSRALVILGAVYTAVRRGAPVVGLLHAMLAGEALCCVAIFAGISLQYHWAPITRQDLRSLRKYFAYGLPLVPYTLLVTTNAMIDRYFIAHLSGVDQAGVYALSYGLIASVMVMGNAIAYVIYPRLSVLWAQGDTTACKGLLGQAQSALLFFAVPSVCGLMVLYPEAVRMIAGSKFVLEPEVVAMIGIAHVFLGLYGIDSNIVDLGRGSALLLVPLAAAALVNVLFNAVLIPVVGLFGAAIATMASYLVQWLGVRYIAGSAVGFHIEIQGRMLLLAGAGSAGMCLAMAALPLAPTVGRLALAIAVGGAVYLAMAGVLIGSARREQVLDFLTRRVRS